MADPETWISVVMCVKDGADPITRYDLNFVSRPGADGFIRTPTAFSISGSADGLNYEMLATTNDIIHTQTALYSWLSDGTADSIHPENVSHAMLPLAASCVQTSYNVLNNVRSVSVAAGSTLRFEGSSAPVVSCLAVDAAGGIGTIDGLAFAVDGVLSLGNVPAKVPVLSIPADFRNATGLSNIARWGVEIGGKLSGLYRISSVSASSIRMAKPGFRIVFR